MNEIDQHNLVLSVAREMTIARFHKLSVLEGMTTLEYGNSALCDDVHECFCPWIPDIVLLVISPSLLRAWSQPYHSSDLK